MIDFLTISSFFGGNMQRLFRLSILMALLCIISVSAFAQKPQATISGRIAPGEVKILQQDSVYTINHQLVVAGTLIIEPGTTVYFYNSGRIIDSVGGRIIADGYAYTNYNANPDAINPVNLYPADQGGFGYADMRYFLYRAGQNTINVNTHRDVTVNPNKFNHVFNVLVDTAARRIVDLINPNDPAWPTAPFSVSPFNNNHIIIPFEYAIMFNAARMNINPNLDPNLKVRPWARVNQKPSDFTRAQIRFVGQPENNISREWGHIVVLPGARAAFFRNVKFEGFRKDTTVDRLDYYAKSSLPELTDVEFRALNNKLRSLTNGAGGALTSFSSRTWLLNCTFANNMARNRGGALQLLQTPAGYPRIDISALPEYPDDKNPNITDKYGKISEINKAAWIPNIDNIDAASVEPLTDYARQGWDDARLSVYLGRVRNLKFDRNKVVMAEVGEEYVGNPPVKIVRDIMGAPATYPQAFGNKAFGGALYISGDDADENRQIEIGLGVNNKLLIEGKVVDLNKPETATAAYEDTYEATSNLAINLQNHLSTFGARGGAIYVGKYTSLLVAGSFIANETQSPFLVNGMNGVNNGAFSMGGAIFMENTLNRLSLRGGPKRADIKIQGTNGAEAPIDNSTLFSKNRAGSGGALYVDGNASDIMSPVIGGWDTKIETREYGFNIKFIENSATSFGGAVYTKRNMSINGAGGVENDLLIGYGGHFPVTFMDNMAGYAGGALAINIPNSYPATPDYKRSVHIIRASFENNHVGKDVVPSNVTEIRGGGAIYSMNGDLNLVKGTLFLGNKVHNGNGGAIAMVSPSSTQRRFFLSDLDHVEFEDVKLISFNDEHAYIAKAYHSTNNPFTFSNSPVSPDARMLTRFFDNEVMLVDSLKATQLGSGTTQIGKGTPVPSEHMNSTVWLDAKTGFVAGENGKLIKFAQGGTNWTYLPSNTNVTLTDVHFTTDVVGYAAGAYRTIIKTTNAGASWAPLTVPAIAYDPQINDINFVGTDNGYAVLNSGYILTTANAGATWNVTRPANRDLFGIAWTSINKGYVVGERGLILKTTNGGTNWDIQIIPGLTTDLTSVIFKSQTVGYAIGKAGVIIKTTDAGDTWDFVTSNTDADLKSLYFYGQTLGFIVGSNGTILKSTDGGTTWAAKNSGKNVGLNSVYFVNANDGYIAGNVGLILKTTDGGETWTEVRPKDETYVDVKRYHQETSLPENGIGLGGAIYILDKVTTDRIGRIDTVSFNRVRIQGNKAFSGSAVYSDNYDLKLIFNRSLITSNLVDPTNTIGLAQNYIAGPVDKDASKNIVANHASSDLASATIYGEVQGPLPSYLFSEAANTIYANTGRFLVRLPDAPNTKGILAGTTGIGLGGTDTLRGNYWGQTEANIILEINNDHGSIDKARMETFFVDFGDKSYLPFTFKATADPREQGPFESIGTYTYRPIPLENGSDENTPSVNSIPEKLLFSGRIYDLYDKGTDVKTADYSKRRMSPIEDFAVGIPPVVKRYADNKLPSFNKYVKRWMRDPFIADSINPTTGELAYKFIKDLQNEWKADKNGFFYHPIGYPMYLESEVDYSGDENKSNLDKRLLNESVYFVINETTGDYIRVNMKQVGEDAPYREVFRARVDFVPDSSNRNSNSTVRRTAEGLLNLGSNGLYPFAPYSNPVLLEKLYRDAYNEDAATLQGRKYHADYQALAKVPNLFSNRPTMPASNFDNGISNTTYFAGERYRTLPVDTGDVIRVVSRTVLWREGVLNAYNGGIVFKIVNSTMPPVFTGDIPKLANDTIVKIVPSEYPWRNADTLRITEFLNKIFVTENRAYPVPDGFYSDPQDPNIGIDAKGRDRILTVTAVDTNGFYDPRAILFPNEYSALTYSWNVDNASGLKRWLMVEHVKNSGQNNIPDGHIFFKGQPINPYVVPGGEDVQVAVYNYPPHWRLVDSLRKKGVSEDYIAKLINIFPAYFSNPVYDNTNARFLQQDTIDCGSNFAARYSFKLFVIDSVPRFLNPGDAMGSVTVKKNLNTYDTEVKDYVPSEYPCGVTPEGKLIANYTDALRFKVDFNTDDELEDNWAIGNWDFRYGKHAFGFASVAVREGDAKEEIIVDPMDLKNDPYFGNATFIKQLRPNWLANKYLVKYTDETIKDNEGVDLTTAGQIRVNIPKADAETLLKMKEGTNNAYTTDTLFALVASDGHGGFTTKTMGVFINFAPVITTTTLADATEDIDYNPSLVDSSKRINIFDANMGQGHTFELIYPGDARNEIAKDPCFAEAGKWNIANQKTTPTWLKINKNTGLLYGTPGIDDAPATVNVTVLVTDANGLTVVKSFPMNVNPTNHEPVLTSAPKVKCVDQNQPYGDTIYVSDRDLIGKNKKEVLTLEIVEPVGSSLRLDKTTINGPLTSEKVGIYVSTSTFDLPRDNDGKVTISIKVTDQAGKEYILTYRLEMSEPTDFIVPLTVTNSDGAFQTLFFGTGANATTGDATDNQELGTIDFNYCEYEIPALPPADVFDARWTVPTINGLYRNIYPTAQKTNNTFVYTGKFQAGGEDGSGSKLYPVILSWKPANVPAVGGGNNPTGAKWFIRDAYSNGNLFSFEMTDPDNNKLHMQNVIGRRKTGDPSTYEIVINNPAIDAFIILHDWTGDVNNTDVTETKIQNVTPNPVSSRANISFSVMGNNNVTLDVIDNLGNVVAKITDAQFASGNYTIDWNIRGLNGIELPSGAYTVRMIAGSAISNFPVVIVK